MESIEKVVKAMIQTWSGLGWESKNFKKRLRAWIKPRLAKQCEEESKNSEDEGEDAWHPDGELEKEIVNNYADEIVALIGNRIPDLFRFDHDTVTVLEVEDTSPLTRAKLNEYCRLWFGLDTYHLRLELIVTNLYGTNPEKIPLQEFFYTFAKAEAEEMRRANPRRNVLNRCTEPLPPSQSPVEGNGDDSQPYPAHP